MNRYPSLGRCLWLLGLLLCSSGSAVLLAADTESPQYYELRMYTTQSEAQQRRITDYWRKSGVSAYNRLGIGPVGVFSELHEVTNGRVVVLIPFATPAAYAEIPSKLASDAVHQTSGAEYLNPPRTSPSYERMESSLLVAFEAMKQMAVPASTAGNSPWIYELRIYESHSESKGINKVRMFNNGEIPLMKEVGLTPVFFGQTLVGPRMPNLVYMVSGENPEAHQQHWKAFFEAPVWKSLIGDSQYQDNVSKVTSLFLKRAPGSQI